MSCSDHVLHGGPHFYDIKSIIFLFTWLTASYIIMKVSVALLGSAVAATALSTPRSPSKKKHQAIDPTDFVHVDGLRLKDTKGLHYITVGLPMLN